MATDWTQGGFIAGLGDGRRVYLEFLVEDPANQDNVRITVQALGANQTYPELDESDATVDWTDEVELLNELLKRVLHLARRLPALVGTDIRTPTRRCIALVP